MYWLPPRLVKQSGKTTIAEALLIGIYLLANAIGQTSIALDVAKWTTLALILYSVL